MIVPCEIAVKSVVPAIKALLVTELVTKYSLKQEEVAGILGISQSAVSKYQKKVRGHIIRIDDIDKVRPLINDMIEQIMTETPQTTALLRSFCQICSLIRNTTRMCKFCKTSDAIFKFRQCAFCLTPSHQ